MPGRRQRPDAGAEAEAVVGGGGVARGSRLATRERRETLPASSLVESFRVENEGIAAAILGLVGCQMAQQFGPGETGTGQIGPGKSPGSRRECGLPKLAEGELDPRLVAVPIRVREQQQDKEVLEVQSVLFSLG